MSSEFAERSRDNIKSSVLHSDVSWGTKGDTKVSTDLGVVKSSKGDNAVDVAVPTAETDINAAYEDAIHVLSTKPPKEEKKVDAATAQEDYYRTFRTKCAPSLPLIFAVTDPFFLFFLPYSVLLAWVLSNVGNWSFFGFIRDDLCYAHHIFRHC
jgi:hypothetical protein